MNPAHTDVSPLLSDRVPRPPRRWLAWVVVGLGLLFVPAVVGIRWWWSAVETATPVPVGETGALGLSAAAQRDAGITLEPVKSIMRSVRFEAPGALTLDERHTTRIGALVEGKIITLAAEVGDRVAAGALLATMHSQVVHLAWADYRKAVADRRRRVTELTYAQHMEARAQRLYADKALPLQEVQRAHVERVAAEEAVNMAQTEVRRTEEALEHLGVTSGEDPSGESGEYIPITTPLAGAVLEKLVTVGTAVIPGAPLFVVSDLSTLWATAEVDETKLPLLRVGRTVEVRVAAYPDETFTGTIIFVSDTFDAKTRRVSVRCRVPNPLGRLKPQMYATLSLGEGDAHTVTVAPASAVQVVDGKPMVFLAESPERFSARAVTVGATQDGWTEILTGLRPGEQVVTTGSFLLKSELKKQTAPEE